ncbi:MAG: penicillin acylase family protein, partial [bacterium]
DSYGLPHLQAESAHDLFFAAGVVQAMDRLPQMDHQRRLAGGRLAEVSNDPGRIASDTWFRTLGFRGVAERMWQHASRETRAALTAYAEGVNAYLAADPDHREWEFRTLDYQPEPWSPIDSLMILRLVGWGLAADYDKEVMALDIAAAVGPDDALDWFPGCPDAAVRERMRAHYPAPDGASVVTGLPAGGGNSDDGSNVWVVAGSRTASGQPILASDPHLSLCAPSIWYEMHLSGGGYAVAGFTFPGLPIMAIGHNEQVAWGATNYPADTQDLFLETINLVDGTVLEPDGSWVPLTIEESTLAIRDVASQEMRVLRTPRGPIVRLVDDTHAVSLAWTGWEPTDEIAVFLKSARARSVEEFQQIFRPYGTPAQNFYCFDRAGHIGAIHAGLVPQRLTEESCVLRAAIDPASMWIGWVSPDDLGPVIDPVEGYAINANNKPVEAPTPTGNRFTPPFRYERIAAQLESHGKWTVALTSDLQNDTVNLGALAIVRRLRAHRALDWENPDRAELWVRLLDWEGDHRADEIAATLWHGFMRSLSRELAQPVLGPELWARYQDHHDPQYLMIARWLDGPMTVADQATLSRAFETACDEWTAVCGPDPATWRWSAIHVVRPGHPGGLPQPAPLAIPHPGSRYTVNVTNCSPSIGWHSAHGVSFRFVAAVGEDGRIHGQAVVLPGVAGNPLSPHAADQAPLWSAGELRSMPFHADELETVPVALILAPAESSEG